MNLGEMSQTRQRAWLAGVIWTLAGVGFLLTFFSGGGAGGFAADSTRHVTSAAAVGFGFGGYGLALWFTRHRQGAPPVSDERDLRVAAQANQVTLIVVLVGVYVVTMGLWIVYETGGLVPAGWMWFVAYGSAILAFVASSVTTLILDARMGGHG